MLTTLLGFAVCMGYQLYNEHKKDKQAEKNYGRAKSEKSTLGKSYGRKIRKELAR